MAITKDKKKEILKKLEDVTDKGSVVFLQFKGLSGNDTVAMRKDLRDQDVSYFVAKKTLVKRAFDESDVSGEMPELEGELALAYGDDLTTPAREVFNYQKKFKDNIQIMGGVFESKFMNKSEMEEIAQIPSHDVLKGMFVNVINSPIQGFAMAIKAIADKQEA